MSLAAYKNTIRESEGPRQIERRVFARITGKIESFAEDFDAAETYFDRLRILASGLRAALEENSRLWHALKFDLSHSGNTLPPEMRAGLISLALFVERQTSEILGGDGDIFDLLEVNRSVLAGLSGIAPEFEEV